MRPAGRRGRGAVVLSLPQSLFDARPALLDVIARAGEGRPFTGPIPRLSHPPLGPHRLVRIGFTRPVACPRGVEAEDPRGQVWSPLWSRVHTDGGDHRARRLPLVLSSDRGHHHTGAGSCPERRGGRDACLFPAPGVRPLELTLFHPSVLSAVVGAAPRNRGLPRRYRARRPCGGRRHEYPGR